MRSTSNPAKSFAAIAAFAVFALWSTVQAQETVTEQADGSVAVTIEGEQFLIPAPVAEAVERVVLEYADDPAGLRDAIGAIVSENAGNPAAAGLAAAIATLAVFHAGLDSPAIAAIALGASQGNRDVAGESLIAAIPGLRPERSPGEAEEEALVKAQATVENPSQVSPVQ